MFEVSPAELVVVVAWLVGIACALARLHASGPRPASLILVATAILLPVVGSVVAVAVTLRGARAARTAAGSSG